MADSDSASYIQRFNLISKVMEYFVGADWYPLPNNGGNAPTPNVVQNIETVPSNVIIQSDTSFIATHCKCTITPSSSTAKIKLNAVITANHETPTETTEFYCTIYRDTTAAAGSAVSDGINLAIHVSGYITAVMSSTQTNFVFTVPVIALDTPGDTNPHTYTVVGRSNGHLDPWDIGELNMIIAEEVH